jgi:hypothetical protein
LRGKGVRSLCPQVLNKGERNGKNLLKAALKDLSLEELKNIIKIAKKEVERRSIRIVDKE